jgi:PEP-CTERM motif
MSGLVKFAAGAAAALALSAGIGGAAQASTWVLDYTANNPGDTPFSATLDLTASNTLNAAGGYDITAISGFVDGDAVAALTDNPNKPSAAYSTDGLFIFDNVLWTSGAAPVLSNPGLLFTGVSGHEYNLFSDDMTHYEMYQATPGYTEHSYGAISLHETFEQGGTLGHLSGAVPEPAAWTMMILGFGGIGFVLRQRRARPATITA